MKNLTDFFFFVFFFFSNKLFHATWQGAFKTYMSQPDSYKQKDNSKRKGQSRWHYSIYKNITQG